MVGGEKAIEDYEGEYSTGVFRSMLRRGALVYVAEEGRIPVGFLEVERDVERKGLYLRTIAVAKAHRGKGIGNVLFDKFESLAKKFKVRCRMFSVCEWNKPMRSLARKRGYRSVHRLVLYLKRR